MQNTPTSMLTLFCVVFCGSITPADEVAKSNASVLNQLFAEQHVPEAEQWIAETIQQMPDDEAVEFLTRWVLPGDGRDNYRVSVDYVAGEPAVIMSPATMLIARAQACGKLTDVEEAITASPATTAKERFDRNSLLALVAIADGREAEAVALVDELYQTVEETPVMLQQTRDAVLLLSIECLKSPELTKLAAESLPVITQQYRTEYKRTTWHRHLTAACAAAQLAAAEIQPYRPTITKEPQWYPISVSGARERGLGFPESRWTMEPGSTRKVAGHGEDFLFYRSPLVGNFEVETHATGFGYRESQLLVGGHWTGLLYTHDQHLFGDINGERQRAPLIRKLADTHPHGYIHHRAVRTDDWVTTFLNGVAAHSYAVSPNSDPWLAVRSNYRVLGGVDDLRISGSPSVPESIAMIDSTDLLSWHNFYFTAERHRNRLNRWQGITTVDESGKPSMMITSSRDTRLPPDSLREQLLVYTRPVLEDGEIAYDFWFSPGQFNAAPYLAGTAFLITEEGVTQHHVTNGRYDRSAARPDQQLAVEASEQLARPALKANAWNRMKLIVKGDQLTLALNGQNIYRSPVTVDPLKRNFGLFHFDSRTSLSVRNATWKGDWSSEVPAISDQQLVDPVFNDQKLAGDHLLNRVTYALNRRALEGQAFTVTEGNPASDIRADDSGITIERIGRKGYQNASVGRALKVRGDFDISVDVDEQQRTTAEGKVASILLSVVATDPNRTEAMIQMVSSRDGKRMVQCAIKRKEEGKIIRNYFSHQPFEASKARIQLSRRGSTIFYLAAENDSSQVRIIGQHEFPTDDLETIPFRFGVQSQGEGTVIAATFKSASVRAAELSGHEVTDPAQVVAELNRTRDDLPLLLEHDFSAAPPSSDLFYTWADASGWKAEDKGFIVKAAGAPRWQSAGLTPHTGITGDFDIQFDFRKMPMITPAPGKHTQIYLQAELQDSQQTQFNIMLTKTPEQKLVTQAQVRNRIQGKFEYSNIANVPKDDFSYFRLARRGTTVHFLAGNEASNAEQLLASREIGDATLGERSVRMMLHTGNSEGVSQMLVRSIQIRAEGGLNPAALPAPAAGPTSQKSVPRPLSESVLDSLKGLFK